MSVSLQCMDNNISTIPFRVLYNSTKIQKIIRNYYITSFERFNLIRYNKKKKHYVCIAILNCIANKKKYLMAI